MDNNGTEINKMTGEEENNRKKKLAGYLPGIMICLACAIFGFTGGRIWQMAKDKSVLGEMRGKGGVSSTEEELDVEGIAGKIQYLKNQIEGYYLEEADYEEVENYIYKGMLAGLGDPYSEYYTQEEYAQMMESTAGAYCGIGATLQQNQEDGTCTVVSTFEGSPAREAGLTAGDRIIRVDDTDVTGMDLNQLVSYVKGEENTGVVLTIIRDASTMEVEVIRRTIEVETVTYEMLSDGIGYISISEFDDVSLSQFQKALAELENQGMKGLLVDLRNNPGGVLTVVNDILDEILPESLLVYTEDKYGNRQDYYADDEKQTDVPMVVLVNEYSASASEIFAGAMKDYGRATLVGTTTYGKGIVQRIVDLEDGSAIKLTIAKYYTPSGENIHGTGITPDIEIELSEEAKKAEELTPELDNQLQKGLEILKEKIQ